MVNIDKVYQKVLAIANKEQRGYITPQEFNLMADKAQVEIFDSYFYDIKTSGQKINNQMGVAFDEVEMIQEKLHPFHEESTTVQSANDATYTLPTDLYYINVLSTAEGEITEMTRKEIIYTQNNPLTKATTSRPIYVREDNALRLYPTPTVDTSIVMHYWKRPTTPSWAYVVVNENALYDSNNTVDFELHASEEESLVMRILELSGVIIRSQDLAQAATYDQANTLKQQND